MAVSLFVLKLSGKSLNNIPFQVSQIMTGSMEPTLHAPTTNKRGKTISGDVVIIIKKNINKLKEGDIIAYLTDINFDGIDDVVVHRIISITNDSVRIAGDAEGSLDETLTRTKFNSKYLGKIMLNHKAYITTWLFRILTQAWGFIVFIALPLLFMIVRTVLQLIKILKSNEEVEESSVTYNGMTFTEDAIKQMIEEKEKKKNDDFKSS